MNMRKMIWTHNGKKEPVLMMGVYGKPPTPGFSSTIYACIMTSDKLYSVCPINELSLTTKDYNWIFAD